MCPWSVCFSLFFLQFLKIGLFVLLSCKSSLFWMRWFISFISSVICRYFFPVCGMSFYFHNGVFWGAKVLNLGEVQFFFFLLCNESFINRIWTGSAILKLVISRLKLGRMARMRSSGHHWALWMQNWRINSHPVDGGPGAGWTLAGCCSRKERGHLPGACLHRWASAGGGRGWGWGRMGGCLPYPGSWPLLSRWCHWAHLQGDGLAGQGLHGDLHFDLLAIAKNPVMLSRFSDSTSLLNSVSRFLKFNF